MHKNSRKKIRFTSSKRRSVEGRFDGGEVSSDGGLILMREADRRLGLIKSVASRMSDERQKGKVRHEAVTLLRQRVMALCAGWEGLNDAEELAQDPVHQLAIGADELGSAPTLSRFGNAQKRASAWAVNAELVEQFIRSHRTAPPFLILDFDATDTPVHGQQEGRFFHGYYDCHCFLPLYVFCGDQLLVAYLPSSPRDSSNASPPFSPSSSGTTSPPGCAPEAPRLALPSSSSPPPSAITSLIFSRLALPTQTGENSFAIASTQIKCRGRASPPNPCTPSLNRHSQEFKKTGQKQRLFTAFDYAALTWHRVRWVIAKAEHSKMGANPRFVVTNIVADSQRLYDRRYCARGEIENRVKEQMMLFANRVSAHRWWANQWRLLLSALAYTLIESVRRLALAGTELAEATCQTIRLKLIKIGTVIER